MEVPLGNGVARTVGGILAPEPGAKFAGISAWRVRETSLLAEAVNELGHQTQALEVEQMRSRRKGSREVGGVVRRAEGDGGMAAVRQTDDDVRTLTVADADDGQLLPAERMMRMRDGHASRRGLGRRGSAL
jgi:hypothetical protein